MGILNNLFGGKKGSITLSDKEIAEAGVCPNCWGDQEYEGAYIQFTEDHSKSNVNHDAQHQKAFIQQFVETNVSGIRLKKDGNEMVCSLCKKRS